ncbi:MAG: hypothetical protein JWN44_404 [Myxococcales bacterium]|nr:hypothetical protein [Myxococcales bacterium]
MKRSIRIGLLAPFRITLFLQLILPCACGPNAPGSSGVADIRSQSDALVITSPLSVTPLTIPQGATVNATVGYSNSSSATVTAQRLVITARPPGGSHTGGPYYDFQPSAGASIAPQAGITVAASLTFAATDPVGTWELYSTYQDEAGAWHDGASLFVNVVAGESPDCTQLTGQSGSIIDASQQAWTLVTGPDGSLIVDVNGVAAGYSDQVIDLVYVNHVVSQENSSHGWWSWTNGAWTQESDPRAACGTAAGVTAAGVPLPSGWSLKVADHFGTGPGSTVSSYGQLHAKYYEEQWFSRDSNGLATIPNVVINGEQETYGHFEDVIAFSSDHLTIQGRGHADNSISSGAMVSVYSSRNFCVEARYQIPNADKSWPAFWVYSGGGGDGSEIDVEQPVYSGQSAHTVSMFNHAPYDSNQGATIDIFDSLFTPTWMQWTNPAFDASTSPHVYTTCYDDTGAGLVSRYIDGKEIYSTVFKWNASLLASGTWGPDPGFIMNLAVGGGWPGNLSNPSSYYGNLDVYSIDYYGP